MSFKIKSNEKNDIGIITIEGEIDMFTSPDLLKKLLLFFQRKVKTILVDLSGVTFMDSAGVATLVEGLRWSKKKNGGNFILTGIGVSVKKALVLTKLDNVFDIK